jgi:hypothetical protein
VGAGAASPDARAGARDSAALLQVDVARGAVLRRLPSPRDGRPHLFNDLVVASTGEVLLTDSDAARVYRLAPGGDSLVALPAPPHAFTYPNGVALSPDERRLYVAHVEGVTVWDRGADRGADWAAGRPVRLAHPDGVPLVGIDGLYACGGGLVAVQGLPEFTRVVWLRLDGAGARVVAAEVLEQRHPAHVDPTTGVLDGDALHYVASSELRRLGADGALAPAERPSATVVLRLPLGGRCAGGRAAAPGPARAPASR